MDTTEVRTSKSARIRSSAGIFKLICAVLIAIGTTLHAQGRPTTRKVPPVYPEIAKTLHIGGVVMVSATVNPSGDVTGAKAEGGNKLLALAAEEAVKKWKFVPGKDQTIEQVEIVFNQGN